MSTWFGGRREPAELRVVQVTTRTGQAIKGVLLDQLRDGLILRAASVGVANARGEVIWHPLDGDTVIPNDNVDFWQSGLDATFIDGLVDSVNRRREQQS